VIWAITIVLFEKMDMAYLAYEIKKLYACRIQEIVATICFQKDRKDWAKDIHAHKRSSVKLFASV
jgi:hypothetical protein